MANVPNLHKAAAGRARQHIVDVIDPDLYDVFKKADEDMKNGAWESTAADSWYIELIFYQTTVRTQVSNVLGDLDAYIMAQPDEVPEGDERAVWNGLY